MKKLEHSLRACAPLCKRTTGKAKLKGIIKEAISLNSVNNSNKELAKNDLDTLKADFMTRIKNFDYRKPDTKNYDHNENINYLNVRAEMETFLGEAKILKKQSGKKLTSQFWRICSSWKNHWDCIKNLGNSLEFWDFAETMKRDADKYRKGKKPTANTGSPLGETLIKNMTTIIEKDNNAIWWIKAYIFAPKEISLLDYLSEASEAFNNSKKPPKISKS